MLNVNGKSNMVSSVSLKGINKNETAVSESNRGKKQLSTKAKVAIGLGIMGTIGLAGVLIKKKCDAKSLKRVNDIVDAAKDFNEKAKINSDMINNIVKKQGELDKKMTNRIAEVDKAFDNLSDFVKNSTKIKPEDAKDIMAQIEKARV